MKIFNPKVSIVIPVYNGSKYLKEAIDSALAQTYKNIEIIVVNDGSNDEGATEQIAKSYGSKIKYFKKENGGVSTALNLGISKMTGEYFSWLSHDDIYKPYKVEKQIAYLSGLKDKKVVLYMNWSILKDSKIIPIILDYEMLVKKSKYSLLRDCANGITLLIPKNIIDEIGQFNTALRYTQDYDYWFRIQKKYKFIHMAEVLTVTRIHAGQDSAVAPIVKSERDSLWIRMIQELPIDDKIRYENTERNFYSEMADFLRTTPYKGALKFCEKELAKFGNLDNQGRKMKKFNPKVSIVIPVYNGSKYLGEAIDSALAQTYKNLEIIVSNDGSNDDGATEKVAKSYGGKIIYSGKKENGGASTALNAAIKVMTGEYFSWLSHDDMYYPNKIQRQIEELAKLKNKNTIMMSELDGIDENHNKIYQTNFKAHMNSYPARAESYLYPVVYNQTHGCTLLIPRDCFEKVGLFDVGERVAQDFEYFYRIFLKYPHKLVPEILVTARDTSNRMGRRAKPRASIEYSRLYIKMIKKLSNSDISLLAPDKLSFLIDMRMFFKEAGYIPALEFITEEISNYSAPYCDKIIKDLFEEKIDVLVMSDILQRALYQLNLIYGNMDETIARLDNLLKDSIIQFSETEIIKYLSKSYEDSTEVYHSLIQGGYKRAAVYYMNRLINFLIETDNNSQINELMYNKLIGNGVDIEENDIDSIIQKVGAKSKKTRILFSSTHWLTGGMERVLSIIFDELKTKYDIFLLTPFDGVDSHIQLPKEVTHIKVSNAMFYYQFDNIILSYVTLLKVDVAVGVYNMFAGQLDFYRLCKGTGIKTIASNHEYFFYPYKNKGVLDVALNRLDAFRNVDAVVWPTSFSAAIQNLGSENGYLIGNPNAFKVHENKLSKKDQKIVICVGRFDDYTKRIDRILRCFKLVTDKEPEAKLMLVGKCTRDKPIEALDGVTVNDMIASLGIDENNLIFAGEVNNVDEYYSQASVLVLASNSEGFGMVINEAACFGVPTVYNMIPGLEDLVTNGENGYVVEQDDIESMADRVCQILADEKLREKLSSNAIAKVKRFDATIIGKKWEFLIDTLVSGDDDTTIKSKLKEKLSSEVTADQDFSKKIFAELNIIFDYNADINTQPASHGGGRSIRAYGGKVLRSLKSDGLRVTTGKIARKVNIRSVRSNGGKVLRSLKSDGLRTTVRKIIK